MVRGIRSRSQRREVLGIERGSIRPDSSLSRSRSANRDRPRWWRLVDEYSSGGSESAPSTGCWMVSARSHPVSHQPLLIEPLLVDKSLSGRGSVLDESHSRASESDSVCGSDSTILSATTVNEPVAADAITAKWFSGSRLCVEPLGESRKGSVTDQSGS